MDAGSADRASRREDRRFTRVLRDRAILQTELAAANAERAALQAQLAAERAAGAKATATGLGNEVERAEADLAAAVQDGDATAIARANRRMAELAASRTAATIQAQASERDAVAQRQNSDAAARQAQQGGGEARLSPETEEWVGANAGWYGRDQRMTRQAQVLHAEAAEDGMQPGSPEYWRYIEAGLETRFPGKVARVYLGQREAADDQSDDGEAPAQAPRGRAADPAVAARVPAGGASGAAPAQRGVQRMPGQQASAQRMPLSEDAQDMIRRMGITPEMYRERAARLGSAGKINLATIRGR